MTMPDQPASPRPGEEHPEEELAPLLNGELGLDDLRRVVRHVRRCPSCQAALVEVAAAVGALRRAERTELAETSEVPALPPLRDQPAMPKRPADGLATVTPIGTRRRRLLVVAAAVILIVGTGLLVARAAGSGGGPAVKVAFSRVGSQPAQGSVKMSGGGASRTMTVSATLAAAPTGSYYEVWLLDASSGGMVPVGVLPSGGTARFSIPSVIVAHYNAVDISLQRDNGSTLHSNDSILRATYSA